MDDEELRAMMTELADSMEEIQLTLEQLQDKEGDLEHQLRSVKQRIRELKANRQTRSSRWLRANHTLAERRKLDEDAFLGPLREAQRKKIL